MIKSQDWVSNPSRSLSGTVMVPGDKSMSHRAVILGSIAEGTTTVSGFLEGADCLATVEAFRKMGVRIEGPHAGRLVVHGAGKYGLTAPQGVLDCGNSGTTMRLLAGLLAAQQFDSTLTGDVSLRKRPMERVSRPLNLMGAEVLTTAGFPPVYVHGGKILTGITWKMPVASAQVKSALLLAALYAEGETCIVEPSHTRDHTERMLAAFSCPLEKRENAIVVHPGHVCMGADLDIPGDISSAAFLIVAATVIPGSEITLLNTGINPGRTGILHILERMGADIRVTNKRVYGEELVADLVVRHAPLDGIDIPASLVPLAIDEFPAIFVAAACAKGLTTLHGASELRTKESDRLQMMATGLRALGVDAEASADGMQIQGGSIHGGVVDTAHDHRIAMAFAIAGAVADSAVTVRDCTNVITSFPGFIATSQSIGLDIREVPDHD